MVLLAGMGRALPAAARDRLRAGLERAPDWDALVGAALDHGTAALLCRHLLAAAPDLLPDDLRAAAAGYVEARRQASIAAAGQLFEVLDGLAGAGIDAVAFKGLMLAEHAYGDIAARGIRDLDVLVRPQAAAAALAVLGDLGYRSQAADLRPRLRSAYHRYNGQDILFAEGRLPVEPHWAFAPRTLAVRFPAEGVLDRAVPCRLAGRAARTLSAEDALIVAGIHGAKEQWARLIWIADVAALTAAHPTLDWDMVIARATAAGVRRMVLLALALARRLAGTDLPPDMARMVDADGACGQLAGEIEARLFLPPDPQLSVFALSGFAWRVRERLADRLRSALSTITTARLQHFRALDLPDGLAFAYPVVKVAHDYLALPAWSAGKAMGIVGPGRAQRGGVPT